MELKRKYEFELRLKQWLQIRDMTQRELAYQTGLREATISELARDSRSTYNKEHLIRIMDALRIPNLNDLLVLHIEEKPKEELSYHDNLGGL